MKVIEIDDATDGMVLAEDVRSNTGQVLTPKGLGLTTRIVSELKDHGIEKLTIEDERPENITEFGEADLEKTKKIYREVIEQRFIDPSADHMVQRLFQAVLEHFVKRVLPGE